MVGISLHVLAQLQPPEASPATPWISLGGKAVDLSVGIDGSAWALDQDGQVWLKRDESATGRQGWQSLPGKFLRIDAYTEKDAWALDEGGQVFRYMGSYWKAIASPPMRDIAATSESLAYAISQAGELLQLNDSSPSLINIPGAPKKLKRLDVNAMNQLWVVDEDGRLFREEANGWMIINGRVNDIATGANDTAMAIGPDGHALLWRAKAKRWQDLDVGATAVAVGADSEPWLSLSSGGIFKQQTNKSRNKSTSLVPADSLLQVMDWRRINGTAQALAISASGKVMALSPDGQAWQRLSTQGWSKLPGRFSRLTVLPNGEPWALDNEGRILRFSGSQWLEMPSRASELSAGSNGVLWVLLDDGRLAQWQSSGRIWQAIEATSPWKTLRSLAVESNGAPWIINQSGQVNRFDGNAWQAVPGVMADALATGPDGSIFALAAGQIRRYNRLEKRWLRVTGQAKAIAVGPQGMPWIVTNRHEIYASAMFDEVRPDSNSSTPAGQVNATAAVTSNILTLPTSKEILNLASFKQVQQVAARDISIGKDGGVFALAFDGSVIRWNNGQQRFLSYPGQFKRIATAPDGQPWGISTSGEVWHHTSNGWARILNITAQDIDIGADGTVIIAATDNSLHRFNQRTELFDRLESQSDDEAAPSGYRVAVDHRGQAWTLDRQHQIRRCSKNGCEVLPQLAIDIDIGPEGSIFIVAPDYRLYRLNATLDKWESIGIEAETVSVGPAGKPWIVNTRAEVWYSALFSRDESRDIAEAAVTASSTASSSVPIFSFTINLPFETIPLPGGLGSGGFNMAELPSGKMVVFDKSLGFWVYDPTTKKWQQDVTIPSAASLVGSDSVRSFQIAPDGSYWLSNTGNSPNFPQVWRRAPGGAWQTVLGLNDSPDCDAGSPPPSNSLAIASDGAVYATSRGCNIYRYDPLLQRFMPLTNVPRPPGGAGYISLNANGRPWVGSHNTFIYEYNGNNWVKRSQGSRVFAIWQCLHWEIPCVATGANGSVFSTDENAARRLTRWNPIGGSWDTITSSPVFIVTYVLARDGRPWVWDGVALYRAK
jgi:Tectonin domain